MESPVPHENVMRITFYIAANAHIFFQIYRAPPIVVFYAVAVNWNFDIVKVYHQNSVYATQTLTH